MNITFEAEREGYSKSQVWNPLTVGELKAFLEDYTDENGIEYVKINGNYIEIDWLILHDWEVNIAF